MASNETTEVPEDNKTKTDLGRKRINRNELQLEEPPAKKGTTSLVSRRTLRKLIPKPVMGKVADRRKFTYLRKKPEEIYTIDFYANML